MLASKYSHRADFKLVSCCHWVWNRKQENKHNQLWEWKWSGTSTALYELTLCTFGPALLIWGNLDAQNYNIEGKFDFCLLLIKLFVPLSFEVVDGLPRNILSFFIINFSVD